jgi:hypothetical protein
VEVGRAHAGEAHVQPVIDLGHPKSPLPTDLVARQLAALKQAIQGALGELQALGNLLQREQIRQRRPAPVLNLCST